MERMGDFESERPSRESDYYWNNTDFSRRLRYSRAESAEGTSAVGTVEANPNLKSDIEAAVNTDRSKGKVLPLRKVVEFSKTPPFLVSLGVPEANIISRADILRKIKRRHLLTDEQIADLPNRYSAPVAVMRDGRSYVILTDMEAPTKTSGEKPVMVYLKAVGDKAKHNFIASAYAREANKEQAYIDLIRSGKLIYMDESRIAAAKLEDATLLQFKPQAVHGDFTSSIPQTGVSAQGENLRMSRSGIFTGAAADYANRSRQGGVDDGPSVKKIGTGEGSQVYGWGLYGSTVRGVAEGYARAEDYKIMREGKRTSPSHDAGAFAIERAFNYGTPRANAIDVAKEFLRNREVGRFFTAKEQEKALNDLENGLYEIDGSVPHLYEQTFFTDRAPGDESHLLKWYDAISDANWDRVIAQAEKEGLREKLKGAWWLRFNGDLEHFITDNGNSGDAIYESLSRLLGSPQAASEFLARAGIDGVKYPVDSYGGKSVKDGDKAGWNYVAFSDEHIRVDHKWTDGQMRYSRRLTGFDGPSGGMAPETAAGETTPGARAANRQRTAEERDPGRALWEVPWHLNPNGPGGAPVQKPLALGMAETVRLVEALTGKSPTSFRRTRTGRNAEDAWTSKGRVGVAKDLLRVLDEGDAAKVREKMIAEGYFRADSDPTWAVTATPDELEADRTTSDGVFANRMRSIYMGRVKGTTPGGMRGATQVMANELGRIIMQMPADTGAVGRGIRTLGQGIIADFSGEGKKYLCGDTPCKGFCYVA